MRTSLDFQSRTPAARRALSSATFHRDAFSVGDASTTLHRPAVVCRRRLSASAAPDTTAAVNVPEVKRLFRDKLEDTRRRALESGGKARLARQHSRGKLSARERVDVLLDAGTFREYDMFKTHRCTDFEMDKEHLPGDGVVGAALQMPSNNVLGCAGLALPICFVYTPPLCAVETTATRIRFQSEEMSDWLYSRFHGGLFTGCASGQSQPSQFASITREVAIVALHILD